jgi:hypothetical protein
MTIFAVLMPTPQPNLVAEITKVSDGNFFPLNDTQYLISASGTAVELCVKLGIYDAKEPNKAPTGSAVVVATSSYFGRAPATVWDWMKAKLEAPPSA